MWEKHKGLPQPRAVYVDGKQVRISDPLTKLNVMSMQAVNGVAAQAQILIPKNVGPLAHFTIPVVCSSRPAASLNSILCRTNFLSLWGRADKVSAFAPPVG